MFEVGDWEENTERQNNLISDLFGTKVLHLCGNSAGKSKINSAQNPKKIKKRKRKKIETNSFDATDEERGHESVERQLKIDTKKGNYLNSDDDPGVDHNFTTKLEAKRIKRTCLSSKNTELLGSNESMGKTISKKRRQRKRRQKEIPENNTNNVVKVSNNPDNKKKIKKQHYVDTLTTDNQNSSGISKTEKVKQVPAKKIELQDKLKNKLESSRFRWINEQLYNITGDEAMELFGRDKSMFDVYHRGFRRQVEQWPVNPVDIIISWIKQRPNSFVVADFGCGDAAIAKSVPNKVHSFDLVAKNDRVTACNMAKVPLSSNSIDIAIFCLSLMGTDIESFTREAYRVLKPGGTLKIAEVVSRIDVNTFVPSLCQLGFKMNSLDDSNKMFILLDFIKDHETQKRKKKVDLSGLVLKPCIYKRR